ncbi:MAG: hypothetical protein PUB07_00780 [Clostridia bacterium]|nr:hypothetical protein [Clostridia bacterium]
MLHRIFTAIDRIQGVPRYVMTAGLLGALVLLCIAVGMLLYPTVTYAAYVLSKQMCETAVTLFAEGVILGLFLDALLTRIRK